MTRIFGLLLLILLNSCSSGPKFSTDRVLFEASKVNMRFREITDINDIYFVIKENNFFEYYRQLFDSLKNSSFPGRYTKNGDTLLLEFYDKKGYDILGKKAIINRSGNEIVFFNTSPALKFLRSL